MGQLDSIVTLATVAIGGIIFLKVFPLVKGFLGNGAGGAPGGFNLPSFTPPPLVDQPLEEAFPGTPPWTPETDILLAEHEVLSAKVVDIVTPGVGERQITTTPEMFLQAGNIITGLARKGFQSGKPPAPIPQDAPEQSTGAFWVNPITNQRLVAYVPGVVPPSVQRLRDKDILPAIRGI